ncbi:polysaccharide pyruvyl transferase family protein [Lactiplantibacillus plantarum]|uniref:polysaccharide pyruvyl transferase family protein n=2 Tax=Lactiplantibacillus plantarum TaxID=1590 RepID=UPI00339D9E05
MKMEKLMYNTITVLDTSIATENLGDFIIMDAVHKQLRTLFPESFFVNTATHDTMGREAKQWQRKSQYTFIGGTNLLTDRFRGRNRAQWKYGLRDREVTGAIGLGLGWQSYLEYHRPIDIPLKYAQKLIYDRALSTKYIHSVRDSYTQKRLARMGIESINTACVTMWGLTPELLANIPTAKANTVVTTITNYWQSPEYLKAYRQLIETLLVNYKTVKLWIQAREDIEIFNKLNVEGAERVIFIAPNLSAYDEALSEPVDYIGTRLHAGIRALQHQRRSLIVELDNRAREIANDTNLPTIDYRHIQDVANFINQNYAMNIKVPFTNIEKWRSQFIK